MILVVMEAGAMTAFTFDSSTSHKRLDYPLKNGNFHGCCRRFDEKGTLRVEEYYSNGFLNGCRREFDSCGRLRMQERYNIYGHKEGLQIVFDEKGFIKAQTLYVRGGAVDNWLHKALNSRGNLCVVDILRVNDDETRRVCIDEIGYDNFLNQVEYQVVAGEHQSTLIRVNLPGERKYFYFLRTYVSKGLWYLFLAPNSAKTIQQAFAWALERMEGAWPQWILNYDPCL